MKLSIIIPVFNEEKTITQTIDRVFQISLPNFTKEVIVVNDGSTDNSAQLLTKLKSKYKFKLITHPKNQGKGAAIKSALSQISGDYIIIQDADWEYNPADWPTLLKAANKNWVVYGSRELKPQHRGYLHFVWGVRFLTFLVNLIFKTNLTDVYTGFKLFPAQILKSLSLQAQGFEFEMEVTVKLLKKGIKIKEVPIHYHPRKFKEGKKIKTRDGLIGIITLFKNV